MYGDCNYVIAQVCKNYNFTILGNIEKVFNTETYLTAVTIILEKREFLITSGGNIYLDKMTASLPEITDFYIAFEPTKDYYIVDVSKFGLQVVIQIKPIMQLYVVLDSSFKGQMCGLCGNFNYNQLDDFQSTHGLIERLPVFINSWRAMTTCPGYQEPIQYPYDDMESDNAMQWCAFIDDPKGALSPCHEIINPKQAKKNCITDTVRCNEKKDACMCAAIFSYVKRCVSKGIVFSDWIPVACKKFVPNCPENQIYTYSITSCKPTCQSLHDPDPTCKIYFDPLPGCMCEKGFYQHDDDGKCVPDSNCSDYLNANDEMISENGQPCVCNKENPDCVCPPKGCTSPLIYADCGAECAKTCQNLDMQCYNTKCVPGCVCPPGLVYDDNGGCVTEDECPCFYNDIAYNPEEEIKIKCNKCVCRNRKWLCTNDTCSATCSMYGNGHFITFDQKHYIFNGECQYTLSQDYCSQAEQTGTFRIITNNIPCGQMSSSCFRSFKVVLGGYEFLLADNHLKLVRKTVGSKVPYKVYLMGIYLVVETKPGLLLIWDKKSSIFIKVNSTFQGKLCGLCGNYDGNANNDFTTRNNAAVNNAEEFGNSWKLSPICPDGKADEDTCLKNPHRYSWAQEKCGIIKSPVFSACRPYVDPIMYYDACVFDACACDIGGDFECICAAIAAYAQACSENNICVNWRTPTMCPIFCGFYNAEDDNECEWHHKPCGATCMKTCRNPSGECNFETKGLEGCSPQCPETAPYFDEDEMKCVAVCSCYDEDGQQYPLGEDVPSNENCIVCKCTKDGIVCLYDVKECNCKYQGRMYRYNETVYSTSDGAGSCITATCKENGTIHKDFYQCPSSTTATITTVCDDSHCSPVIPTCSTGFSLHIEILAHDCCPTYDCVPLDVCIVNGTVYRPGEIYYPPGNSCIKYNCSMTKTGYELVEKQIICENKSCEVGFESRRIIGQCCSECVQVNCTFKMPDGTITTHKPEDQWKSTIDNCTSYYCLPNFEVVTETRVCPKFNASSCLQGTVITDAIGCCKTCVYHLKKCGVSNMFSTITYNNCMSPVPVSVSFCNGSCSSSSMFSFKNNKMEDYCDCCQPTKTTTTTTELICQDGTTLMYQYINVDECVCSQC